MSDGNKRYLGDVFIDEDNYEYQKQFFRDIIESYQWKYGGSFDASTLQEKAPEDFATAEQGAKADIAILSPLLLGRTEILNLADPQYILTDAILIDKDVDTDSGRFINLIQWFEDLEASSNLSEMLYVIYQHVEGKLDTSVYERFIEQDYTPFKEQVNSVFETFTDEQGNEVTKLNADLVNGLRFRLITQEAYDNLSNAEKTYWRNVFIIKDPSEIPALYEDPMKWKLTDGYEFRIYNNKLQVKSDISNSWATICTLNDLLVGGNIRSIINDIMQEDIGNVISEIEPVEVEANWGDYPFLSSSLHGVYIKDILINNRSDYITSNLDEQDSLKYVNINMKQILIDNELLTNDGNTRINNIVNGVNQQLEVHDIKINNLNNTVAQLSGGSSQLSSLETTVRGMNSNITNNSSRISILESAITKKQDKEVVKIYRDQDEGYYDINLWSNDTICFFRIEYNQTNLAKSPYNWPSIGTEFNEWPIMWAIPDQYAYYRPGFPTSAIDPTGKVFFSLRDSENAIYIKSLTGKAITKGKFVVSMTYVARGALRSGF